MENEERSKSMKAVIAIGLIAGISSPSVAATQPFRSLIDSVRSLQGTECPPSVKPLPGLGVPGTISDTGDFDDWNDFDNFDNFDNWTNFDNWGNTGMTTIPDLPGTPLPLPPLPPGSIADCSAP